MHEPYAGAAETHSAVVYFAGDRPWPPRPPTGSATWS